MHSSHIGRQMHPWHDNITSLFFPMLDQPIFGIDSSLYKPDSVEEKRVGQTMKVCQSRIILFWLYNVTYCQRLFLSLWIPKGLTHSSFPRRIPFSGTS